MLHEVLIPLQSCCVRRMFGSIARPETTISHSINFRHHGGKK